MQVPGERESHQTGRECEWQMNTASQYSLNTNYGASRPSLLSLDLLQFYGDTVCASTNHQQESQQHAGFFGALQARRATLSSHTPHAGNCTVEKRNGIWE
jgi:hypothetical protein